jgi:hypothetical protein
MTDKTTLTAETYSDLTDHFGSHIADDIARILNSGNGPVVVAEAWLAREKDLAPSGRQSSDDAERVIFAGAVDGETDKAWQLKQADTSEWMPKSCATLVESDGQLTSPQATLTEVGE